MKIVRLLLVLLLSFLLLLGVTGGAVFSAAADGGPGPPNLSPTDPRGANGGFVPGEVLAPADSLPQALQIAAAYNLELKSYAWGIAVLAAFDPKLAVAQSKAIAAAAQSQPAGARLPELSLNLIYEIYDTAEEYITEYPYHAQGFTGRAKELYNVAAYGDAQWHHAQIDSERAWVISRGAGVTMAFIDSGIDINHPKFAGKILASSYNSYSNQIGLNYVKDDLGHGTHVSGVAAASQNGDTGVCGVAPEANILMIKANNPVRVNEFNMDAMLRGVNYAVNNGANIINISLGRIYSDGEYDLERNTIINAVTKGVTVVCAAGNDRNDHASYPAAYPETIAVSAIKQGGVFDSEYSNYGPEIDLAAPGTKIYSTRKDGGYMEMNGTSLSSPCVAGVAALIKSLCPHYTPQQVRAALSESARRVNAGKDNYYGYGIVDAYGALQGLKTQTISIGGAILYQPSPRAAKIVLYNSEGTQVAFTDTDEDGAYKLSAQPGAGYTLVITKPAYISYTIKNLTLTEGEELKTIDMRQMGGDINGDGYINSEDLVCLISEYGRAPVIYPLADIDGDGLVNSVDLTCLLAGYGRWDVVVE